MIVTSAWQKILSWRRKSKTIFVKEKSVREAVQKYQKKSRFLDKESFSHATKFNFRLCNKWMDKLCFLYYLAESLAGRLADKSNGFMTHIDEGTNLRTQMSVFFNYLASHAPVDDLIWTEPYVDAGGLGLVVTVAKAVFDRDIADGGNLKAGFNMGSQIFWAGPPPSPTTHTAPQISKKIVDFFWERWVGGHAIQGYLAWPGQKGRCLPGEWAALLPPKNYANQFGGKGRAKGKPFHREHCGRKGCDGFRCERVIICVKFSNTRIPYRWKFRRSKIIYFPVRNFCRFWTLLRVWSNPNVRNILLFETF